MIVQIMKEFPVDVEIKFPLFLGHLDGEYGFSGYKKQYWKFESRHKLTVITERICETTILTYDDPKADFVKDMLTEQMLDRQSGWILIPEIIFDKAVQHLIDKLFKS